MFFHFQSILEPILSMMIVTPTNFEGFTRAAILKYLQLCGFWVKMAENAHFRPKSTFLPVFQNCCLVKPSKFITVTIIIGHTTGAILVATPLSTPTLINFLMILF